MEQIKQLIGWCVENPVELALWVSGVTTGAIGLNEILMKLSEYTPWDLDDKIFGKVHEVLLNIREKVLPFTRK